MSQSSSEASLRPATLDELPEIDALMKSSTRDLFPNFYDAAQTEASIQYIASVDRQLVEDGTYFVLEAGSTPFFFGENIQRLRTKQGLSQDDLARKAELKYSTLAKIEGDFVKKPGAQMIAKLAKAFA